MTTLARAPDRYSRSSRNLLDRTAEAGLDGARAAVETFYRSFNTGDLDLLRDVWLDEPLVQLCNPLGGLLRGREAIVALYARVFAGAGSAGVEFEDVVEMVAAETVVFAGREHGEFAYADEVVPLRIRTSRIVAFVPGAGGWRMIHHHGSIDDASALRTYQEAVRRSAEAASA